MISVAVSSRPPYVFMSKMIAAASLLSAAFTARRKNASSDGETSPRSGNDHDVAFVNHFARVRGPRRNQRQARSHTGSVERFS